MDGLTKFQQRAASASIVSNKLRPARPSTCQTPKKTYIAALAGSWRDSWMGNLPVCSTPKRSSTRRMFKRWRRKP